jgi:hypothetical protein
MPQFFSTREVAELAGLQLAETWRVRRLFEDGTLPEPPQFAGKRAIPRETLPAIFDKLRDRGWLPQTVEATR